jgi:hypothetical protein
MTGGERAWGYEGKSKTAPLKTKGAAPDEHEKLNSTVKNGGATRKEICE